MSVSGQPTSSWIPCPYCFRPSEGDAAFCASCGKPLRGVDAVAPVTSAMPTTPIPTTPAMEMDTVLAGRYRLVAPLGRGSYGEVHRARDEKTGRDVALKLLSLLRQAPAAERETALRWFRREVSALGWLSHPGIVARLDVGEEEGIPFFVMELVDGETLADRMARGPLALDEAVDVLKQLLAALSYAHASGVVHRDLKPANLLVTAQGVVKVSDFGIAKLDASLAPTLSATGGVIGTPYYMSPEQASDRQVDLRSDLFSVGVLAYELFTRVRPFEGSVATCIYRIIHETPRGASSVNPALPHGIDAFCRRALEKSPELRFQGADEMAAALLEVTRKADTEEMAAPGDASVAARSTGEFDVSAVLGPRRKGLDAERLILWASVVVLGVAAIYAAYLVRSEPGVARPSAPLPASPVAGPALLVSIGSGAAASVYLDGRLVGKAGSAMPLPPPGEHLITVVVAGSAPVRRKVQVDSDRAPLEVKVQAMAPGEGDIAIPEELTLIGSVLGSAKHLALLEDKLGHRAWFSVGERAGDGRISAIRAEGVKLAVPLCTPDSGEASLTLAPCDVDPGSRHAIGVRSEPTGAEVKLGRSGPTVGLTPFDLEIERGRKMTLLLRSKGREALLEDLDPDRLLTMQELYVVFP